MLLSVIIPVYKVEPYLRECIDSVLAQSYTNLEVILVDDGSPDACPAICDEYVSQDARVKVIHQTNQGLSAARNAGIEVAQGSYIAFVDSDDYISPTYFEAAMEQFAKEPSLDIVELPMIARFNTKDAFRHAYDETAVITDSDKVFTSWFACQGYLHAFSQLKVCRSTLFTSLRFPVGVTFEDLHLTPQLLLQARSIAYIAHPTANYFYRWRNQSITAQARFHDLNSQMLALQEIAVIANHYDSITPFSWADFTIAATNILIDTLRAAKQEGICVNLQNYANILDILQSHKPSLSTALTLHKGWHTTLKAVLLSLIPLRLYLHIP
ncbi:MAG: glycosyltransferase family 2 protein [Bacteroidaceae bacterium]|nr:glycosyltransferase family 2 protein [Bacteroidaceae bacterium]